MEQNFEHSIKMFQSHFLIEYNKYNNGVHQFLIDINYNSYFTIITLWNAQWKTSEHRAENRHG